MSVKHITLDDYASQGLCGAWTEGYAFIPMRLYKLSHQYGTRQLCKDCLKKVVLVELAEVEL